MELGQEIPIYQAQMAILSNPTNEIEFVNGKPKLKFLTCFPKNPHNYFML
jgi:hypothetical protein